MNEFLNLVFSEYPFNVGFVSYTVPALIRNKNLNDPNCLDIYEGARFSTYITIDMQLTPCSFDQDNKFVILIKNNSISEAWNSETFENFRKILKESCPNCNLREDCLGGCPIIPDIILCPDK